MVRRYVTIEGTRLTALGAAPASSVRTGEAVRTVCDLIKDARFMPFHIFFILGGSWS